MGGVRRELLSHTVEMRSPGTLATGVVFDVKRFAVHDGPGIRTTVFLKGCPLRCHWCHNPESQRPDRELLDSPSRCHGCGACVAVCPAGAIRRVDGVYRTDRRACSACGACVAVCPDRLRTIVGEIRTVRELMEEIERDSLFYEQSSGGVTISGGEPLAQHVFTFELLRACKDQRIHTALDTCGHAPRDVLERMADGVDLYLYDLKHTDPDRHLQATGVTSGRALDNLEYLASEGRRIWIRIPLIPGFNDDAASLEALGRRIAGLGGIEAVQILPYHRIGEAKRVGLGNADGEIPAPLLDERLATDAVARLGKMVECEVTLGG